jgi:rhamnosyltransferase
MESSVKNICALIVSFHPDSALVQSVLALLPQVAQVLVVDNGSDPAELADLYSLQAEEADTLAIVELKGNFGLGYAQNTGIQWILERGFSHVLLLDHDSIPEKTMVDTLWQASKRLLQQGHKVSAVGPQAIDRGSLRPFFFLRYGTINNHRFFCPLDPTDCVLPVDFLMASGTLIAIEVLQEVGLMDATLFIEHADTDWCLRASALGYQAFAVCEATLSHHLGDRMMTLRCFGYSRQIAIHSPLRDYYLFRNTIWLFFKPSTHWRWVLINTQKLTAFFILFGLFVPPRWPRLTMMAKGIWDGFAKRPRLK